MIALAIVASVIWKISTRADTKAFVFINESNDHSHDESIRVSILAAMGRSGVQNAVVISDSAPKPEVLFKKLKLGTNTNGKAILYVFRPNRHELDIEVGYALESLLPDATIKAYESAAKTFTYSNRMQDFWAELLNTLNMQIGYQLNKTGDDFANYDFSKFRFLSGGAGIAAKNYDPSWKQFLSESKSTASSYHSSATIEDVVEQYINAMADGDVSKDQLFLAPESNFFRLKNHFSSFYFYRNANMYRKTRIARTYKGTNLAVVFFSDEYAVLPLFLRRIGQYWYVSEPLSWSLFQRFEDSNRVFLKYPVKWPFDQPNEELTSYLGSPLYPGTQLIDLAQLLKNVEQHPQSSEFQLFVLYDLVEAKKMLEMKQIDDLNSDEAAMLCDIYNNLGEFSNFLRVYGYYASLWPGDIGLAKNLAFYRSTYVFNEKEWLLTLGNVVGN